MIFLDGQTGTYLHTLLKKQLEKNPADWIAKRLLGKVQEDDERKQQMKDCTEHDWNPMTGHHTQCNKCWALKDGYEVWETDDK